MKPKRNSFQKNPKRENLSREFEPKPGTPTGLIRIYGRNPVHDMLKLGLVRRLEIADTAQGSVITEIYHEANLQNIPISRLNVRDVDSTITHQGVFAEIIPPKVRHDLEDFLDTLPEKPIPLLLMLDGISDPQNYGAILRTAVASEVSAVIVRERRQAPLTETVIKSSAGGAAKIPIFETTNLSQTIEKLTKRGFWSVAACQDSKAIDFDKFDWSTRTILIVGAEGEGVSELLLKNSDHKITIPMSPKMESLNVSVATGILLFSAAAKRGLRFAKS